MLQLIGVPLDKLKFVQGTDYQLSVTYTQDVYKMNALVTTDQTTKVRVWIRLNRALADTRAVPIMDF